jgi:hypothetical protein
VPAARAKAMIFPMVLSCGPLAARDAATIICPVCGLMVATVTMPAASGPVIHRVFTGKTGDLVFARRRGLALANDSTHYLHSCRRHHNRAVTGLWLTSLHDGKRGTCQVSQGASCLGRHQPLLDIRNGTRAFATLTSCGSARAFATTRKRGSACAFPTTRNRGTAFLPTRNR